MTTQQKTSFPHRHNADGSHDSICSACYVTVASAEEESELAVIESAHKCDPEILYRYSEFYVPERVEWFAQ